jgi:hypothetical protein
MRNQVALDASPLCLTPSFLCVLIWCQCVRGVTNRERSKMSDSPPLVGTR